MRKISIIGLIGALAMTVACGGKSEAEKAAEQAEKAAVEVQKAAEQAQKAAASQQQDAAKGAAEMVKGFEAIARGLGAAASGGTAVEPVSFRELQAAFPEVPGWTRGKPTGEKMSIPVSFSQSEVEYQRGEERVAAKLVDSGFNQILLAPFSMFLIKGFERETPEGYEKSIELGSNPGWERWNAPAKDGELNVFVAKRFLLTLDGDHISDTKPLYELANRVDFARLSSLK